MTLADDLLPVAHAARGIAGELGFRPYRCFILDKFWTGQHTGEGNGYEDQQEITEGGGQPPKIHWFTDEEIALGNLGRGTCGIGPITPAFSGGGTDLETLQGELQTGATRHVGIVGPKHPNGARYVIIDVQSERSLRYMIRATPIFHDVTP
jgi:hypothetical protein